MMFDMFRTSCSLKPKEYNPEHEVFLKRDPIYQSNRTRGDKKNKLAFPAPHTPHLNWGGGATWFSMKCLILLFDFFCYRGRNKCGAISLKQRIPAQTSSWAVGSGQLWGY